MIDPHVIVGKVVHDISGNVINLVEPYWPNFEPPVPCPPDGWPDNQELRSKLNAAFSRGGALEGVSQETFAEFLEFYIKDLFHGAPQFLRPSASSKGIKITGTLPYMFALPPGPLGIAYIILDLLEKDLWSMAGPRDPQSIVCPAEGRLRSGAYGHVAILDCTKDPEPNPGPCDPECEPPEQDITIAGCVPDKGPVTTCE